ncbi:esterase-like activity of phytase family protein [Deinococcus sp. 14RED07]|uniref:esterase-like activity of phytase family protein n=1 Tax=Deinococcus sp. 14RED07 TaxID=2745874 RepID=UPI001E446F62|nr:esterase-like activity of phytase family protein [Deinococcus sp. 14RED07]
MKALVIRLSAALLLGVGGAQAVTLAGYAELPADTLAPGPASGAWRDGLRGQARFQGQPVQGFSGVQFAPDGTYLFLSDNGFGAKNNSADYLLRLYRLTLTPKTAPTGTGKVEVGAFVQLRDPERRVPWAIVNEASPERLLTGADFDPEGFVVAPDGTLWVGDEFGPYLLHFSADGVLLDAPMPTPNLPGLPTLTGRPPLVIGHRGSSGTRPEHTLEAYRVAIEAGADFIEPDLVVTKDGVLVARHEPVMVVLDRDGKVTEATTDVATRPEFAGRVKTKNLDGQDVTGYWIEDFTLAELKTLRALERLPALRGRTFDGQFEVPTLSEIIALIRDTETRTGRRVGIYPETKHPTFMTAQAGVNTSQLLIDTLKKEGFTDPARVFIQSFETGNLRDLHATIMPAAGVKLPLVQLLGGQTGAPYDLTARKDPRRNTDLTTPEGLRDIATYASGIGPSKGWIIDSKGQTTDFVTRAHAAGLLVHPYTFRNEPTFLPAQYANNPEAEMRQAILAGVDGLFTDFPATGAKVVAEYAAPEVRSPQHPAFTHGGSSSAATLGSSGGFEGLTLSPDGKTLHALLEKTVAGDTPGQLRLHAIDLATKKWTLTGRYPLDAPGNAIGDITPVNASELIVIERDGGSGDAARTKRLYRVSLTDRNTDGTLKKTLLADLLNIADPQGLAPSTTGGVFRFPYVTIENVIVLDATTVLVANDNNYPGTGGRGAAVKDTNEFIWLKLDAPLTLAPGVGRR